ncbi:hypothetical protein ALI144C_51105 [Actinosynnema sp. ALI-1.44]|nr:hypothetical protein ALI144C_51105 [Actinosynnema sp. ALI-1.44]
MVDSDVWGLPGGRLRRDDLPFPGVNRALQPALQGGWIADSHGETDALQRTTRPLWTVTEDSEQVPSAVITSESMDLVNHDRQVDQHRPIVRSG